MAEIMKLNFEAKATSPNASKLISGQSFQVLSICFAAGQGLPEHKHPNMTVIVQVLTGKLELSKGEHKQVVVAGQLAMFSGDEAHALKNIASNQSNVLVTVIPNPS